MSHRIAVVVFAFCLLAVAGTTACVHKANLDWIDEVEGLDSDEAAIDARNLETRVTELFDVLKKDKISTYNTREKLRPFFKDENDLADFVAIYGSSFREFRFRNDRLRSYVIRDVVIEQNGVIARVRIDLTGRLWAFFPTTLKEVQKWQKSGGIWYMTPHHH